MFHDDCFDSLEHAEAAKEPEPKEPTEPKPQAKPCCMKGCECNQ